VECGVVPKHLEVRALREGQHGHGDYERTEDQRSPGVCALPGVLPLSLAVGERSPEDAEAFMADLAGRLAHRVQVTTDGFPAYVSAIAAAFGSKR
jgi:hypothetical protein